MLETCLAGVLAVATLASASSQMVQSCSACAEARTLAAAGDTARAISLLREAVQDPDPTTEAMGLLGTYLAFTAPARAVEFEQRGEARELLQRAIDADSDDPRWWYAMGILERKLLGKVDAIRFFRRAVDLVADGHGELSVREKATLMLENARALEEYVLDFQGYLGVSEVPVVQSGLTESCPVAFCLNFERPRRFHEILLSHETEDELVEEHRAEMRSLFGAAFLMDPGFDRAARGWLGELARSGEWEAYVEVARRHVEASPDDGWGRVFLGAGLWRLGESDRAGEVFDEALRLLPAQEAAILENLDQIVRKEAAERWDLRDGTGQAELRKLLWTQMDPLLLTDRNERRLEHYARAALAELWFSVPRLGIRGVETDRGVILLRYGAPRWIRRLRITRAARAAISNAKRGMVEIDDESNPNVTVVTVNYGAVGGSGGRWILWTYSRDAPSFIFQQELGRRIAFHEIDSASKQYEEDARDRRPSSYRLPGLRSLEHQVARFKGTRADVETDVIVGLPRLSEDQTVVEADVGFFVIPRSPGGDVARLDARVELSHEEGETATFRVPVNAGTYPYSVEVRSDGGSVEAAARAELRAEAFSREELALSDLLLARSIEPATADPADRRDFTIRPSADLTFLEGAPVGIYFEVYGLVGPSDGEQGEYRVQVRVREGDEDEGFVEGVIRRLSDLLGSSDEMGGIRWSGTFQATPDRVPEWFTLTLPDADPGTYTLQVTVTEPEGNREAAATRTFRIRPRR